MLHSTVRGVNKIDSCLAKMLGPDLAVRITEVMSMPRDSLTLALGGQYARIVKSSLISTGSKTLVDRRSFVGCGKLQTLLTIGSDCSEPR